MSNDKNALLYFREYIINLIALNPILKITLPALCEALRGFDKMQIIQNKTSCAVQTQCIHKMFFVILILCGTALGRGMDVKENPLYSSNEIIIKLKISRRLYKNTAEIKKLDNGLPLNIKRINDKFKIEHVERLFKVFDGNSTDPQDLKNSEVVRAQNPSQGSQVPQLGRFYKIKFDLSPNESIENILRVYQESDSVENAELNYIYYTTNTPNDPYFPMQWPLNNVGQYYPASGGFQMPPGMTDADCDAPEVWQRLTGDENITVAVIDTGVDYDHRDLSGNTWINSEEANGIAGVDDDNNGYIDDVYGYDFINDDNEPLDDNGHGTHCAGTIAAKGDNGLDITGVCWDARIMAVKGLGENGGGTASDLSKAIYYAVENGADILSNSWGSGFPSSLLEEAFQYACSQGVICVAAAGNGNTQWPFYPAFYDGVISVAATDSNDQRASFSNFGPWVDMAAPGVDILSLRAEGTQLGKVYDRYTTLLSGTSMACPHVAGACVFLLSNNPSATHEDIRQIFIDTGDAIDPNISRGGRLNLNYALLRMLGPQGSVIFESDTYSCSDIVRIKLFDRNIDNNNVPEISISVDNGDNEILVLHKTTVNGIYQGFIQTSSNTPVGFDGILQVENQSVLQAAYSDANDGSGTPAVITDTASVDCIGPEITINKKDLLGPEPKIIIETNELSVSEIFYCEKDSSDNLLSSASPVSSMLHELLMPSVLPNKKYCFFITATDLFGNKTVYPDNDRYLFFRTDSAGTLYVPQDYDTIQEGIDHCWSGGEVVVAPGLYTGWGNRDISFKGKSILVRSESGAESCVIDCNGSEIDPHRGFYFNQGEDNNSILLGFTILNGYAAGDSYLEDSGGAVLCDHSSPTIEKCVMKNNAASWDGGAVNNFFSNPVIKDCTMSSNRAIGNDGGAINNHSSSPLILSCTITGNSAFDWGGAVRNIYSSKPDIIGCLIAGNKTGGSGGAVFAWNGPEITIDNCTLADNSAPNGNEIAADAAFEDSLNIVKVNNSILANDGNVVSLGEFSEIRIRYSNVSGGYTGDGNMDKNPLFVSRGVWDVNGEWSNGDYHLAADSPCINAGDPDYECSKLLTDIDNQPRIIDGRVDMGADEYVPIIEAMAKISPRRINLRSKGILAVFVFVPGNHLNEIIDPGTLTMQTKLGVVKPAKVFSHRKRAFSIALFRRSEVFEILHMGRNHDILVNGSLTNGISFRATGKLNVLKCRSNHWPRFYK